MKKLYFLFFIFILLWSNELTAQCVFSAGADKTIVCGESVQLNIEPNFLLKNTSINTNLKSVFFTNTENGYAVGYNGQIFKTIDGGNNWSAQSSGTTSNLNSVYFTDALTGYVVGGVEGFSMSAGTTILKTTNGGTNWISQSHNLNYYGLTSVFFTNVNNGFVLGGLDIRLTTNGGSNWNSLTSSVFSEGMMNKVFFSDENTGYVIGVQGKISKTVNKGSNWVAQTSGVSVTLNSLYFINNTGYIVGNNGSILKTTNGGANWVKQVSNTTNNLNSVFFINPESGYIVGANGTILRTKNGGGNWEQLQSGTANNLNSVFLSGSNNGFIVGDNGTCLKLTSPNSYSWTPTIGLDKNDIPNPVVNISETTTYIVTTNTDGCISKDTINVIVSPLTANAGADKSIICGGTVQLNSVTTNYTGTGTLKYKWTPATGLNNDTIANPTATITSDITYTVTVTTPNGCTATDDIKVTVNSLTANAGADKTIICGGIAQLNSVTTNYTGTGTLKYKWTPATGLNNDTIANPTATITSDITYTVTVTTPNGCTATDDIKVTVNSLTANAGADKTIICGGIAQLNSVTTNYTGAGTLKYKWTPATGLNNDTIANPTATITSDITYTVTVTTPNGCTATDDIKVTVNSLTANAGADKTIICGGIAQLNSVTTNYTGAGTLKYKWTPATGLNNDTIANPTATVTSDVTYIVTVTTPNGCTATDQVLVSIIPMAKPEIGMVGVSSNNKNLIAWNKPVSAGIESYYIYRETNVTNVYEKIGSVPYDSLSIYVDNQSLPDVQSNKYKLSILDRRGLESPQSNYHKTMHLAINKGMGNAWNLSWEAYEGFVVSTYNIYRGTTPINLALLGSTSGSNTQYNDLNAPSGDIYYQLEVVSPNSVNPTKVISLQKTKAEENGFSNSLISYSSSRSNIATNVVSGINELGDNNQINIYPNPVKNELMIDFEGGSTFEILNLMGQIVYNGNLIKTRIVQTSNLSSGIYLIKFKTGKIFEYKKIIKE